MNLSFHIKLYIRVSTLQILIAHLYSETQKKIVWFFFLIRLLTKVHHEGINDEDGLGAELKLFQFFLIIEDKKVPAPIYPIYPIVL